MNLSDRLLKRGQRNPNNLNAMNAILTRLTEQSTWRGIILIATSLGLTIQPDYHEHIIAVGMALVGIINVVRKEKKIPKAEVIDD